MELSLSKQLARNTTGTRGPAPSVILPCTPALSLPHEELWPHQQSGPQEKHQIRPIRSLLFASRTASCQAEISLLVTEAANKQNNLLLKNADSRRSIQ